MEVAVVGSLTMRVSVRVCERERERKRMRARERGADVRMSGENDPLCCLLNEGRAAGSMAGD